jgi:hypothetical protein
VKDGSGNPFMERSAIKDCNVQPDAAGTEWKQGHAQKKIRLAFTNRINKSEINPEASGRYSTPEASGLKSISVLLLRKHQQRLP